MGKELVQTNPAENEVMTAGDVVRQVNLIQQMMKAVMIGPTKENPAGVHYGLVPGCGSKPVLLKPGAEKLRLTFRLRAIVGAEDIAIEHLEGGHRTYTIRTHILNRLGDEIATGVGLCSTLESKYRYRGGQKKPTDRPVPKEYWNLKKEGRIAEAQATIGGPGFGPGKINGEWMICEIGEKEENPDIADTYNTVLKMAKKRSDVDGTISALAASDIFTQDIDETVENTSGGEAHQSQAPAHAAESAAAKTKTESPTTHTGEIMVVEKYCARNTDKKTPHQVLIKGKYYGSYDDNIGELMAESVGKEVQISFRAETIRGREYYTITEFMPITDVGGEGDGN